MKYNLFPSVMFESETILRRTYKNKKAENTWINL